MATNRPKGGFYIDVTCPGCGGRLDLQEDFFVLQCSHCGSILRVIMPDTPPAYIIKSDKPKREIRFRVDRHLKDQGLPLTQSDFSLKKIYYPYWKVDALEVKTRGESLSRIETKKTINILTTEINTIGIGQVGQVVKACVSGGVDEPKYQSSDLSVNLVPFHVNQIAGPVVDGVPYSIGMRTAYMKMTPYTDEDIDDQSDFIPVMKQWTEVLDQLSGRLAAEGMRYADPNYVPGRRLVQATGSIVYFPYFICNTGSQKILIDGINGRVVHETKLRGDEQPTQYADPHIEFGKLTVDFHRCPTCGIDLPLTQSHIYICHNCHSVISLEKNNPMDDGVYYSPGNHSRHDPLFPFWVFKLHKKTVAKIAKMAVPGQAPDRIVVPAFRIANFKVLRRLTQRITAAFPQFDRELVETFSKDFQSVDISLPEAITHAEMCLFCEKAVKQPNLSPDKVKINPRSVELLYAPFHEENYFYVDSVINAVTFAKNTIVQ